MSKRDRFDKLLLKPDTVDYEFERYFLVNYRTGEIEVNPSTSERDQQRAKLTIEIYALNEPGRPQSRLLEAKKYRALPREEYILDDFPYRFFLV